MRSAALNSPQAVSAVTAFQRRGYVGYTYQTLHQWNLPDRSRTDTDVSAEDLRNLKFFNTKSRQQWDYNRVDDTVNGFSEFRKTSHRPDFSGMREETVLHDLHTPKKYSLHDHFDEYTKPGADRKYQAACAVKEVWDAAESYYPGEQFKRNRPGFRSVPKEILNKQTWYHWSDFLGKWDEINATVRTRSWNPNWPPQGLEVPVLETRRRYKWGGDHPGLMNEQDRFSWYNASHDQNVRIGFVELCISIAVLIVLWYENKYRYLRLIFISQQNGMWYPNRVLMATGGSIQRSLEEDYWWQRPISEFSNQGEFWYQNEVLFGYINHLKRRDAREEIEAAL